MAAILRAGQPPGQDLGLFTYSGMKMRQARENPGDVPRWGFLPERANLHPRFLKDPPHVEIRAASGPMPLACVSCCSVHQFHYVPRPAEIFMAEASDLAVDLTKTWAWTVGPHSAGPGGCLTSWELAILGGLTLEVFAPAELGE